MKKFALLLIFTLLSIVVYGLFTKGKPFSLIVAPNLQSVVEQSLTGAAGRYAVYIKNLQTGESVKLGENEVFEVGSLYKLWVMEAVFEKIKNGDLKEDDNLEENIEDLNKRFEISQEDAEIKEGHLQFTISSAIRQMITISHNYAALMLLSKVGKPIETKTTAQDLAFYFEKLYKGEVIDSEYSQKMLEILKEQKINNRIPKNLPAGTVVAHKTGDIGYFEHDAGIIYTVKGDYIIVVLTESSSPLDADEKIAQISKAVFEYFNKN